MNANTVDGPPTDRARAKTVKLTPLTDAEINGHKVSQSSPARYAALCVTIVLLGLGLAVILL